jgi:hypothetical protein
MVSAAVALALSNAPCQSLNIANPRLGFHAHQQRIESEEEVPSPSVAWAWQQSLAKDAVWRRGDDADEPTDQWLLGLVCDRVAGRVQGEVELQAQCRGQLRQRRDRNIEKPACLEAADV